MTPNPRTTALSQIPGEYKCSHHENGPLRRGTFRHREDGTPRHEHQEDHRGGFFELHRHGRPHRAAQQHSAKYVINTRRTLHSTVHGHPAHPKGPSVSSSVPKGPFSLRPTRKWPQAVFFLDVPQMVENKVQKRVPIFRKKDAHLR